MRVLGMALLLLVGLIAGSRSADAHAAPCPDHLVAAAETVAITVQGVEAVLVAAQEGDGGTGGSAQLDCRKADCCQAGPAVDLAGVTVVDLALRAVPNTGAAASTSWTEPVHRVFRPPARG